jgi:ankyrin repeat protein/tetratricopeptide (TPR) repeat protein
MSGRAKVVENRRSPRRRRARIHALEFDDLSEAFCHLTPHTTLLMKTPTTLLLLLALAVPACAAEDLSPVLQQALFEEEANHNLDAAIKGYQSVVAQADEERKLAATAVFRLGECYRKLGKTNDAIAQYQRVLDQFGDQTNLVTLSLQNLTGLRPSGPVAALKALSPAQAEAHRLLIERLQLEIRAAEADVQRQKELFRQGLVAAGDGSAAEARLLDLRRQLILAQDSGPAGLADKAGGVSAPAQHFSPVARAQMKELLEGEIKVAEQLLAEQRKKISVGTAAPGDEDRFEREVLGLKRQLLAVDGLTTPGERKQWRDMLLEEIALAEKAVQTERVKLNNGKSLPSELAKLQRDVFALKRELVTFDATPTAGTTPRASVEPSPPPKPDAEDAEIGRIQSVLKDSPDLINATRSQSNVAGTRGMHFTMLYQAVVAGQPRVAEFLLANGADVNAQNPSSRNSNVSDTALHAAVNGGNKAMVKLLIDRGAQVDARDGSNETPLHVAAGKGFKAIAELLLDAKADVNAKAYDGTTPLHEAVRQGFRNVAELLMARGADVNAQGVTSESWDNNRPPGLQGTPLNYALTLNKPAMTELLLAGKADPNARNKSGHTPLYYALSSGTNALAMLLKAGANPNDKVPTGQRASWTPLHYFVANGWVEGAAMLLAVGADPNAILAVGFGGDSQKNYAPLMIATTVGGQNVVEMVDLLLANKAEPNLKTDAGNAPLHRALSIDQPDRRAAAARSLVRAGADVNTPDSNGELPLVRAVLLDDKELVELLLQNKANPNARSHEGYTPLHLAIGYRKPKEIVELLLAFKADPNAIDRQGRTPLDYVKSGVNLGRSGFAMPAPVSINFGQAGVAQTTYSDSSAETPAAKRQNELLTLLRTSGGLDYAPRPEQITLTRRSNGRLKAGFYKGTNESNRFTLYELIAAARVDGRAEGWSFPDFSRITISRINPKTGKLEDIKVDMDAALKSGDCSRDVPLQWGDLVNVPEAEHGLNERSHGLTSDFINALAKCLERTVSVTVKGQTKNLPLATGRQVVAQSASGGAGAYAFSNVEFWLDPVLRGSGLLLTSSDLSRVKVKRRDAATGATKE